MLNGRDYWWENRESFKRLLVDTLIGSLLQKTPISGAPQYISSKNGIAIEPKIGTSFHVKPSDVAKKGYPWAKLVVPSSGSTRKNLFLY